MQKLTKLLFIPLLLSIFACKQKTVSLNVLVVWGGDELESFKIMIRPFEESTGIKINIEATRDINAVLFTRLEAGNPPDLANLPNPGVLKEFAYQRKIVPIDEFIDMKKLREDYGESWIELGSYENKLYGIFIKASLKSLIWYSPKNLSQFTSELPSSWDELMELTERIARTGKRPWSIGLESGAASGWPGTDWIEDILLRTGGTEIYDQWVEHKIPWTHPAIKHAWELFGKTVRNEKYLYGGIKGTCATNFGDAVHPLFTRPPGAYLHLQASFIQGFIYSQFPELRPDLDFSFFPFPVIEKDKENPMIVAADLFVAFRDTKQVRAFLNYLATADAQKIWVKRGGAIAPNRKTDIDDYPDELGKRTATVFKQTSVFRFDGSDLMPASLNNAFCKGVLDYISGKDLDEILSYIEKVANESYAR